jgi:hypothetical protein
VGQNAERPFDPLLWSWWADLNRRPAAMKHEQGEYQLLFLSSCVALAGFGYKKRRSLYTFDF